MQEIAAIVSDTITEIEARCLFARMVQVNYTCPAGECNPLNRAEALSEFLFLTLSARCGHR
ncbi:MAG: hypothetical protein DMG58_23830 [Acidobacteria bacterium]|nr:MAG: hypothetical protein DMG58_23830 [Acidobacteriota bacterium]